MSGLIQNTSHHGDPEVFLPVGKMSSMLFVLEDEGLVTFIRHPLAADSFLGSTQG